jgi:amidase
MAFSDRCTTQPIQLPKMISDALFPRPRAVGGLLVIALFASGCSPLVFRKPATPPPHAFISYEAPKPGDKSLRLGVKDLIDIKGKVTSAGSEYLYKHGEPAKEDAQCLRIARKRGIAIVGKTNLSELAIGVSGSNDYFGTPINPVAKDRVPGGSSSGSAVAVALDLADVALGTDTAGSIRVPAACCGVAGLKTTFGLVPTKGVYPISPKYLDTVGPMAKDVEGLVKGMELLQEDFAALYAKAKSARPSARKIRIGRLRVPGTDPAIDRAIDARLAERGFQVIPLGEEFLKAWEKGAARREPGGRRCLLVQQSRHTTRRGAGYPRPESNLVRRYRLFPEVRRRSETSAGDRASRRVAEYFA